jgi:hypothetical protein
MDFLETVTEQGDEVIHRRDAEDAE